MREPMKRLILPALLLALTCAHTAYAFCGFYVAKADTKLFNESSKVILTRAGDRTILSMANDYEGEAEDFALVVPIPYVFKQEQIRVGEPLIFERLDAYSAPRLVEYFDEDLCAPLMYEMNEAAGMTGGMMSGGAASAEARADALGVTIEEQFSVGEYDILILGAEESAGLETWLVENGYNLPAGAREALEPYLKRGMKFFVARVNLERLEARGVQYLRPLVMAYQSDELMLPIQLGMVNARGPQDLVVYLLSPQGRTELSNYRTVKLPSEVNLPEFVEDDFAGFYRDLFSRSYAREDGRAAFLEYAWDMAWCDPCAADPLTLDELRRAGVFWLDESAGQAPNVYLTRLHVRYTPETFPEDLMFRVTDNRENYQARYVLQRPYEGELTCEAGRDYIREVRARRAEEARTLARLTGRDLSVILAQMGTFDPPVAVAPWWNEVFELFD